jgi:hypothetical protein
MKKFKEKISKALNDKLKRIRLNNQIAKEAVKELWRYRGNYEELLEKHTSKGVCRLCGVEGMIITNVGTCVNCSIKHSKGVESKLGKNVTTGKCKCCGVEGTIDKQWLECMNCYAKNGRGGIKK